MQDAMRAVFDMYPEVWIKVYVDDKKFIVQCEKGRRSDKSSKEHE